MRKILAYISVFVALVSCTREEGCITEIPEGGYDTAVFGCHVSSLSIPATKSAFIASSFNDEKITGITVAVYDNVTGELHYKKHFTSGFNAMEIPLSGGIVYDVYALANMGDQTDNLPVTCSALLSDFTYTVPSYSDVNIKGIPMTGRIESYTAGENAPAAFDLRRLFAKVLLNVTMDYDGGTAEGVRVTSLKIGNANAVLSAFGSSRLMSASDRLAEEDYVANNSVDASSVVFYVPENRQGRIGSAVSAHDKNPDRNSAIDEVKDLLTYLDVTVSANSVYYTGTVHYRSYIGADAKSDFNVTGNNIYVWNMTLTEEGLVYDDWKTDQTDLTSISHSLSFDSDCYQVNPRKSIVSTVEYNDSYRGRLYGLGGFGDQVTRWSVIPPQNLPHAEIGISYLDYSYDTSTDEITWAPTRYAPPGDYVIAVETNDGRYYDQAVLRVNDTRWINTEGAYGGLSRETTISRSSVGASTRWNIGYAFGDFSIADDESMASDSPNACCFAGNSIAGNWGQYIGYSLKGNASGSLLQDGPATSNYVSYSLSDDILMGDYVYEIFWKDTWNEDTRDYSLKDTAILHVTGTYISALRINPSTQTIAVGQTGTLRAVVNNSNTASYKKVSWEIVSGSQCISITATDDLNATVTALKEGMATVKATALDGSGKTATATITVNNPPVSLTLVPSERTVYMGTTLQYAAIVTYCDGSTKDVASSCTYSDYLGTIVKVDSNGLATAQNTAGTCSITARYSEMSIYLTATATITVIPRPTPISMDYLGDTDMYILHNGTKGAAGSDYDIGPVGLRLNYSDGSSIIGTIASFGASLTSGNTNILNAYRGGRIRTSDMGITTVTVTCDGFQQVINMYVSKIRTNRSVFYMNAYDAVQLNCYITPYDQTTEQPCEVEWRSEDPSVAQVGSVYGSSTYIYGQRGGTARINLKYEGQYGEYTIQTVAQVRGDESSSTTYLEAIPDRITLNVGETYQLSAKYHTVSNGVDNGGVTVSPYWSIYSGDSYASVSMDGLVTALAKGTARIRAYQTGCSAYVTVDVGEVHHVVTRYLEIIPGRATIVVGGTQQLTAVLHTVTDGNDDGGIPVDASWSISSGGSCASIGSNGLVTATAVGNVIVLGTYTYGGDTYPATATITVVRQVQEVYRIEISPSESTVSVGATQTYQVRKYTDIYADGVMTYHDETGVILQNSEVNWNVSAGAQYATVNASGVATGVASGDATIRAVLKSNTNLTATAILRVDVVFNVDPSDEDTGGGGGNY